ncbi:MAG: MYXO-CTERM sorting domain-containing protein [Rubrivivax sp.]
MIRFHRRPLRAAVAASLLLASVASWAAAVTQTFTLTPDFTLNFSGTPSGSFGYDDAAPLTPTAQGDFTRPLTAFGLTIGSDTLALGDLTQAAAVFDAGGAFLGLAVSDELLTMNPSTGGQEASFAYESGRSLASGAVGFDEPQRIPVPATLGLALLALAAMRRRA